MLLRQSLSFSEKVWKFATVSVSNDLFVFIWAAMCCQPPKTFIFAKEVLIFWSSSKLHLLPDHSSLEGEWTHNLVFAMYALQAFLFNHQVELAENIYLQTLVFPFHHCPPHLASLFSSTAVIHAPSSTSSSNMVLVFSCHLCVLFCLCPFMPLFISECLCRSMLPSLSNWYVVSWSPDTDVTFFLCGSRRELTDCINCFVSIH